MSLDHMIDYVMTKIMVMTLLATRVVFDAPYFLSKLCTSPFSLCLQPVL